MVKIVYCISKLPHLSNEEFHRYWREVHGPIAGRIPGCRKYVMATKEVAAALEDECKFIDHTRVASFITEEHHVI